MSRHRSFDEELDSDHHASQSSSARSQSIATPPDITPPPRETPIPAAPASPLESQFPFMSSTDGGDDDSVHEKIVLRPNLINTNVSLNQLSTLSFSNHTLSPYTRSGSLAHFAVRSGPPRPLQREEREGESRPRKARRKRTFRLGGKKAEPEAPLAEERQSRPEEPASPLPPMSDSEFEFDEEDMDRYFRRATAPLGKAMNGVRRFLGAATASPPPASEDAPVVPPLVPRNGPSWPPNNAGSPDSSPYTSPKMNTAALFLRKDKQKAPPPPPLPNDDDSPGSSARTSASCHFRNLGRLERCAVVLVDAQTDIGAVSLESAEIDVGMHTLLPTTILDDLALVTVAAEPPMRPTRDSQAVDIMLDTPARPSHEGSRPPLARKTIPAPDIAVSPNADRWRHARAPSTKDAARVGYSLPPRYEHSSLTPRTAGGKRARHPLPPSRHVRARPE
ncbi:hypothetical protein EV714DRAFT_271648 [Schizophyllum commune]